MPKQGHWSFAFSSYVSVSNSRASVMTPVTALAAAVAGQYLNEGKNALNN